MIEHLRHLMRSWPGRIGAGLVALLVLTVVVSYLWVPYDPLRVVPGGRWLPISRDHWFGTDAAGKDLFSQVLVGARVSLFVALAAAAIAGVVGTVLAVISTLTPRLVGESVAHLIDVLIAIPTLVLALVLVGLFHGSLITVSLAIGFGSGVVLARILRAEIARVLTQDYVMAAHASGTSTWRTIRLHLLPNVAPIAIVQLSLVAALAILAEAALSYLGLTSRSRPSWGRILGELQNTVTVHPGAIIFPGLMLVLATLGFNLLGDGLRDATDTEAAVKRTGETAVTALLEVEGLTVRFGDVPVVDDVPFTVDHAERLAMIGESGSGKTLTALALIGLTPDSATVSGSVRFDGLQLVGRSEREIKAFRGEQIAMVFQNPQTALNPLMRVGKQIAEPLRRHRGLTERVATVAAIELCDRVGLPDPERAVRAYPHQLSGGQRQRVGIAIALACHPALLIADEPTTALDVTVQAGVLALLTELIAAERTALLFITHDVALLPAVADDVVVMRRGVVVETGTTERVIEAPQHTYTAELVAAARKTSLPSDWSCASLPLTAPHDLAKGFHA